MAFFALIAIAFVATAASAPTTSINSLPGFEKFTPCGDQSCLMSNWQAFKTLMQKGYEPLGLPKMEPLHYDMMEFDVEEMKLHLKASNVDCFHFTDSIDHKYNVDKQAKVIKQEMTLVNAIVKGHFEDTFKLAKEHKFESDVQIAYPKMTLIITRHYALEKRPYGDKTEDFLIMKDHSFTYKMLETPIFKFSDEYVKATSEDKELQEWFAQHGGEAARTQLRMKVSEQFFVKVTDTFTTFVEKFNEAFPLKSYLTNYNEIY